MKRKKKSTNFIRFAAFHRKVLDYYRFKHTHYTKKKKKREIKKFVETIWLVGKVFYFIFPPFASITFFVVCVFDPILPLESKTMLTKNKKLKTNGMDLQDGARAPSNNEIQWAKL